MTEYQVDMGYITRLLLLLIFLLCYYYSSYHVLLILLLSHLLVLLMSAIPFLAVATCRNCFEQYFSLCLYEFDTARTKPPIGMHQLIFMFVIFT